ncbi:hypothetical protein D3C73_1611840 [compost metagenome]
MFITGYGLAEWLGRTRSWRKLLWIVAPLSFILTMLVITLNPPAGLLLKGVWIRYVLPVNMIAIPLILLIVSSLKRP